MQCDGKKRDGNGTCMCVHIRASSAPITATDALVQWIKTMSLLERRNTNVHVIVSLSKSCIIEKSIRIEAQLVDHSLNATYSIFALGKPITNADKPAFFLTLDSFLFLVPRQGKRRTERDIPRATCGSLSLSIGIPR